MIASTMHDFGVVAEHGDSFEFYIEAGAGGVCRLITVVQTERGPRRSDLAEIAGVTWRKISVRVVRELAQGMDEPERTKAAPCVKTGANRLSPLIGRELALLLWALQEQGAEEQLEAILHGWRELAREERWWLYAKAAAPGQQTGTGWRRGLFHALSEAVESRAETASLAEKKSPQKASKPRRAAQSRLNALSTLPESLLAPNHPKSLKRQKSPTAKASLPGPIGPAAKKRQPVAAVAIPR